MNNTSIITLNQEALSSNINFIRDFLNEGVRISSVVKGNAYGHGISAIVPMLRKCGVDHFSAFSANEAHEVYNALEKGHNATIMIMGEIHDEDLAWVIDNDIEFFVFDIERARKAMAVAEEVGKKALIHLEVETGMHRTGFTQEQLQYFVDLISGNKELIEIKGICTHYAGAESIANYVRVKKQINQYNKICKYLKSQGIDYGIQHTACSAAAMAYPQTQMDMVRIGILQYGFWPSKEILIDFLAKSTPENKRDPLKRVITWTSHVMTIKEIKTGDFVGYGTSFLAHQDMTLAVVPVGYGHGYTRALSNQGRVVINGVRVGVIGTVNMNMMMVDISDIPDVKRGTPVILIGELKNVEVSVASFSELSNQLNYELLTRLPQDIPRITK